MTSVLSCYDAKWLVHMTLEWKSKRNSLVAFYEEKQASTRKFRGILVKVFMYLI
jgi:hypothetical protein